MIVNFRDLLALCCLWAAVGISQAQTYTFDIRQNHLDGIYEAGETITFQVRMLEDGERPTDKVVRCILYRARKEISREDFSADGVIEYSTKLDQPGWFQLTVVGLNAEGKTLYHEVKGQSKPGTPSLIRSVQC